MNKKGFSLVELLAVIVVLGVISSVGIVAISRLINNSKETYFESQTSTIISASQSYALDNKSILPKNIGQRSKISVKKLIDDGYIDSDIIKDKNGDLCDIDNSYVYVFKKSRTDYRYAPYIKCPSCGNDYCNKYNDREPKGSVSLNLKKVDGRDHVIGTLSMDGNGANLVSYSYKVYQNNKSVEVVDDKRVTGETKSINIDLTKFAPANIKVVLTIINDDGYSITVSKSDDFTKVVSPSCGNVINPLKTKKVNGFTTCDDSEWKKNREIYISCISDDFGICAKPLFQKTFDTESKVDSSKRGFDYITIYNTDNLASNCPVYSCVDINNPKLNVKLYNRKSDGSKGTLVKEFNINSLDKTVYTGNFNISSPGGAYFEISAEDKISTIKSFKVTYNDYGLYGSASGVNNLKNNSSLNKTDIYSEKYSGNTYLEAEGSRIMKIEVIDAAGNVSSKQFRIEIDRTPPVIKINTSRCSNKSSDNNCKNSIIANTGISVTTAKNDTTKTITYDDMHSRGVSINYDIVDKNSVTRTFITDNAATMKDKGDVNASNSSTTTISNNSGYIYLLGNGRRQAKFQVVDLVGNVSYVLINANIANTCTATYSPNGGVFNAGSNDVVQTVEYGSYFGDLNYGIRNASGGTYNASRDYYHIDASKAWAANFTTYNQDNRYDVDSICPGMDDKKDKTTTLNVNWLKNTCTISYSSNGGSFNSNASDTSQVLTFDDYVGGSSDMRNASGGYYDATKSYFTPAPNAEWFNSGTSNYLSQARRYKVSRICPNVKTSSSSSIKISVNWIINTFRIYNWGTQDSQTCTGSEPYRHFSGFKVYRCNCTHNSNNVVTGGSAYRIDHSAISGCDGEIKYAASSTSDWQKNNCFGEGATIYYNNSNNGRSACSNKNFNHYVKKVCADGNYEGSNTSMHYHGEHFYKDGNGTDGFLNISKWGLNYNTSDYYPTEVSISSNNDDQACANYCVQIANHFGNGNKVSISGD